MIEERVYIMKIALTILVFSLSFLPLIYAASPLARTARAKKLGVVINLALCTLLCVGMFTLSAAAAEEDVPAPAETEAVSSGASIGSGLGMLGAALVTGLSCIGAGIAVSSSASAAIGAISENPSSFGKALIFVALAEGVALYGMLISLQILDKI